MGIRIITDSSSEIEQNSMAGVTVMPMTVTIDGKQYLDGIDLTKDEFYAKLETSELIPVSSLINSVQFEEIFNKVKDDGDEAVVLTISSGLSGTYQSAMIAAQDYDCVSVIDSGLVSSSLGILVRRAVELLNEGKSRREMVEILEKEKNDVVIFAAADTLKYLKKGGRISRGAALLGGILNLKPILTLENTKMIAVDKARGTKKARQSMNQRVSDAGGIDFSRPYAVGYSGTSRSALMEYLQESPELFRGASHPAEIIQIGSAVGTHCGPGAISVTFFKAQS